MGQDRDGEELVAYETVGVGFQALKKKNLSQAVLFLSGGR